MPEPIGFFGFVEEETDIRAIGAWRDRKDSNNG